MPYRLHIQPTRTCRHPLPRSRALYALLMVAVIATGLLWRSRLMTLPPFASKYGGDALWALMVFVGFGLLFPRLSTLLLAVLAIAFSAAVEFSQLCHAPWIEALRATVLGKLILGSTFNWPDLPAYALGVALGACAEVCLRRASLTACAYEK